MKILLSLLFPFSCCAQVLTWEKVDEGLFATEYTLPVKSSYGDSKVTVLRIDPTLYQFKLISAQQLKTESKKAPVWAKEQHALAVFNTGMFKLEGDLKTSTGFMKSFGYSNNPTLNPSYKNVFAFDPVDTTLSASILDLTCDNWAKLKTQYKSFSQCIRMIDCNGQVTWQASQKKWSMVTLAQNKAGEILVLFVRSPYQVREYIKMILQSPLEIQRMMYLEGGPEASLFLDNKGHSIQKMGSYETGFVENDDNHNFWDIPNVIGIMKK